MGWRTEIEVMATTRPQPRAPHAAARRPGTAPPPTAGSGRARGRRPRIGVVAKVPGGGPPALVTRMSTRPSAASASATKPVAPSARATRRPPGPRPRPAPRPSSSVSSAAARVDAARVAPADGHPHALGGQRPGRGPTQSARRARHRRPTTAEPRSMAARYRVPSRCPRPAGSATVRLRRFDRWS